MPCDQYEKLTRNYLTNLNICVQITIGGFFEMKSLLKIIKYMVCICGILFIFSCNTISENTNVSNPEDPHGQFILGQRFYNELNYTQAVYWWQKAAEQGHAEAQYNLGLCFAREHGVVQDYEQAMSWFRKASEQEFALASYNIGLCYSRGFGVETDTEQMLYWYQKTAEQGLADAQYFLALTYMYGFSITENRLGSFIYSEQNNDLVVLWLRKAAEQGHTDAQHTLGVFYANGTGVEEDQEMAFFWYKEAAEQGYEQSQIVVGERYYQGRGVDQNYEQAIYWWIKAGEQGNFTIQNNLFVYFRDVAQDNRQAAYWLRKCAEQGSPEAQQLLSEWYSQGIGVGQNITQALYWRQQSEFGDSIHNRRANPDALNWDIEALDTARDTFYLSLFEKDFILEMNKVRTDPKKYARLYIEPLLDYYYGANRLESGWLIETNEGISAVNDCIVFLNRANNLGLLYPEIGLFLAAQDHINDQGYTGQIGHEGSNRSTPDGRMRRHGTFGTLWAFGENIYYTTSRVITARDIVIIFLINDGVPDRGHRLNIMNRVFVQTGVSVGSGLDQELFDTMCVITYAYGFSSN